MTKYKLGPDINLDQEIVYDEDGTRITEKRAQEIADETLPVMRKTRGRPSLTGRSHKSPQVTFRLTPELKAEAEQIAKEEGTDLSALSRQLLADHVAKKRRKTRRTKV